MTDKNSDNQARLLDFLLGVLEPGAAAEVETELGADAALRARLADLASDFDAVRDALEEPPSNAARDALIGAAAGGFDPFVPRLSAFLDLDHDQTQEILRLATREPEQWSERQSPGVWTHPVAAGPRHRDAGAFLLRLDPGARIGRHRHRGVEWGFLLSGRMADDLGDLKAAGDIVHKPVGSAHRVWNPGTRPAIAVNVVYGGYHWLS